MTKLRAPFPYFGGKRLAAPLIWQALGNPASYCEPFCGSAAVLLARPGGAGRIETINDLSGHVCNFWRAVKLDPDRVAELIDYPVIEIDLHSRHRWLIERGKTLAADLDANPEFFDPKAAAWWAWGASGAMGGWWNRTTPQRGLPELSTAGRGCHRVEFDLEVIHRLSARLRRVRVTGGDWERVVTPAALASVMIPERVGVYLDPPYEAGGHDRTLYGGIDDNGIAASAAAWAEEAAREHPAWRIVYSGYEGGPCPAGFRVVAWDAGGARWGAGGYGRKNGNPQRERLWLSPSCLPVEGEDGHQRALFNSPAATAPP